MFIWSSRNENLKKHITNWIIMPFNKRCRSAFHNKTPSEIQHTEIWLCRSVLTSDFFSNDVCKVHFFPRDNKTTILHSNHYKVTISIPSQLFNNLTFLKSQIYPPFFFTHLSFKTSALWASIYTKIVIEISSLSYPLWLLHNQLSHFCNVNMRSKCKK